MNLIWKNILHKKSIYFIFLLFIIFSFHCASSPNKAENYIILNNKTKYKNLRIKCYQKMVFGKSFSISPKNGFKGLGPFYIDKKLKVPLWKWLQTKSATLNYVKNISPSLVPTPFTEIYAINKYNWDDRIWPAYTYGIIIDESSSYYTIKTDDNFIVFFSKKNNIKPFIKAAKLEALQKAKIEKDNDYWKKTILKKIAESKKYRKKLKLFKKITVSANKFHSIKNSKIWFKFIPKNIKIGGHSISKSNTFYFANNPINSLYAGQVELTNYYIYGQDTFFVSLLSKYTSFNDFYKIEVYGNYEKRIIFPIVKALYIKIYLSEYEPFIIKIKNKNVKWKDIMLK
jgi:hypothetical protein